MSSPSATTFAMQLDDVLRHLPSAVVVFDAAGQIAHINPACLQLFGLQLHPAELIGLGWRAFFERIAPALDDPEPERERIKMLIHQDRPDQAEIRLRGGRHVLRHYVPFIRDGALHGALWQLQDVTEIKQQQGRLEFLTERDPLTGLLNRRGFDRRLHMLEHHPLGQQGYTLALLDLDDFKRVNDTLGHPAGDAVLVETAARIKSVVRLSDMPARIGGDEYAILMPECRTEEQAIQIANRLLQAMSTPMQIAGTTLHQGCSIGLAVQRRAAAHDLAIFQRADLALYDAKLAGRARFKLYSPRIKHRHDLLHGQRELLRDALLHDRLELHFQPVLTIDPQASRFHVRKFEALLRLRDGQGQLRRAEEFETALADAQLGIRVDRWVLQAALRQLTTWREQGLRLKLAVNVSPQHFTHPDFVATVREALAAHPAVSAQDLSLEITEHGPVLNLPVVNATIVELRRMGLSICLDDFGTGNASLSHLQQFDVSVVKIDRGFIRDLLHDGIDLSLSYGMLRLAQMLDISAIAEGVETRTQCRVLSLLGFRHLQGYVFAQPMPAAQVPTWLERHTQELAWLAALAKPQTVEAERAVQALVTHRMRARKALARTLDAAEIQELLDPDAPRHCPLGLWLAQIADRWGDDARYQRLVQAHAEFHQSLTAAVQQCDADADLRLSRSSAEVHAAFWDWMLHTPETKPQPTEVKR